MKKPILAILPCVMFVTLLMLAGLTAASTRLQQQPLPAGHPPIPQELPAGHPPIQPDLPAGHPPIQPGLPSGHPPINGGVQAAKPHPANASDVSTAEAIVAAYYEVVSGPAGAPRDWDRFRSLFIPETRLIAAQPSGGDVPCVVMGVEQFVQMNSLYFERGGYFEREINRRVEEFGNAAHVFSTYEARRSLEEIDPYSRGVNSMQLVYDGERWWIASVMWDYERPESPIPAEFLPAVEFTGGPAESTVERKD